MAELRQESVVDSLIGVIVAGLIGSTRSTLGCRALEPKAGAGSLERDRGEGRRR